MRDVSRRRFGQGVLAGVLGSGLMPAWAQAPFPNKPIRLIVPYVAAGLVDTVARHVGTSLSTTLGVPVLVENRPGVGGNLGAEMVAKSPPDGYTLICMLSGSLSTGAAVYTKLKYDPGRDLHCLSETLYTNAIWAISSSLPIHNMKELLAYAKQHPGALSIGSWGAGTTNHVAQTILEKDYGAKVLHVPYKGEAQIMTDLLAGQVSMGIMSAMIVNAQIKSGKLRAIAATGAQRSPVFPDVPTVAEQGLQQEAWSRDGPVAVFGPNGIPDAVQQVLGKALVEAANAPKMQAFIKEIGVMPGGNMPKEAQANFERYFATMKRVTQQTGVVID